MLILIKDRPPYIIYIFIRDLHVISLDRLPLMMCSGDKNHKRHFVYFTCFNKLIAYMKRRLQGFVMSDTSTRINVTQTENELVIICRDPGTVTNKPQYGKKVKIIKMLSTMQM